MSVSEDKIEEGENPLLLSIKPVDRGRSMEKLCTIGDVYEIIDVSE